MRLSGLINRSYQDTEADRSELLDLFLTWIKQQKITLYSAQEEALLEIFSGKNVILSTPTGSGKSLVAYGLNFMALALKRKCVYTCPVKALVNEKFLSLCRDFGPENVGLQTGDGAVNADAPIICCTAEILANRALREGKSLAVHDIVMDEFHYYSDRERGAAWQIPLLILSQSRFLLMSATLGEMDWIQKELSAFTGLATEHISGSERPVPLRFEYRETPLHETVADLVAAQKSPIYLVCFTQSACAEQAQNLMSSDFLSKEEKKAVQLELYDRDFSSPYGKEVARFLKAGIGLHHAGLLPKYRILVEKLSQKGILKVICGTDTLGVGVNVPIRTVLFTKLCKFDGQKTAVLSVRDFQQIAGRAGRKGFDDEGFVVAQAPEHIIENKKMELKAQADPKKAKKFVKKQPPKIGFVHWNESTFKRLAEGSPEKLQSRFIPTHSMVLSILSRPGDGCRDLRDLLHRSHEPDAQKKKHRRQAFSIFKSLVERKLVDIIPPSERMPGMSKTRLNVQLQDDFSLHQSLSLYLIDTLAKLDPYAEDYALNVLTLVESILENPELILRKQLDRVKTEKMREMKAEGIEYDARMEELEKLEHPKPLRDFIYGSFNEFAEKHPWVGENIRPKSIAREMYETFVSFAEYIKEYELQRVEGLLLRYLSEVYRTLSQSVPAAFKNEAILDLEVYLLQMIRQVDASLLQEWKELSSPGETKKVSPMAAVVKEKIPIPFLRNAIFQILRLCATGDWESLQSKITNADQWNEEKFQQAINTIRQECEYIRTDPEARSPKYLQMPSESTDAWIEAKQRFLGSNGAEECYMHLRLKPILSAKEAPQVQIELLELTSY